VRPSGHAQPHACSRGGARGRCSSPPRPRATPGPNRSGPTRDTPLGTVAVQPLGREAHRIRGGAAEVGAVCGGGPMQATPSRSGGGAALHGNGECGVEAIEAPRTGTGGQSQQGSGGAGAFPPARTLDFTRMVTSFRGSPLPRLSRATTPEALTFVVTRCAIPRRAARCPRGDRASSYPVVEPRSGARRSPGCSRDDPAPRRR